MAKKKKEIVESAESTEAIHSAVQVAVEAIREVDINLLNEVADEVVAANETVALTPNVGVLTVEKIDFMLHEANTVATSSENSVFVPTTRFAAQDLLYRPESSNDLSGVERQLAELKVHVLELEAVSADDLKDQFELISSFTSAKLDSFQSAMEESLHKALGKFQQDMSFELSKFLKVVALLKTDIGGLRRQVESLGAGESTEVEVVEEKFLKEEQERSPLNDQLKKAIRKWVVDKLGDEEVEYTILAQRMIELAVAKKKENDPSFTQNDLTFSVVDFANYLEEIGSTNEYGIVSRNTFLKNGGRV